MRQISTEIPATERPAAKIPADKAPPLSNSERQRRWRERLKAKASGAAVADHARDVVAHAILALWAYHERPGPGGMRWADIDGCRTIEDYVFDLAGDERGLVSAARAFQPGFEGLTPEEARAIVALIDLADVLSLRAIEPVDAMASGHGGSLLGRLLTPEAARPAPKRSPPRPSPEAVLKLVSPAPAADVLELDTPEPDRMVAEEPASQSDRIVRLSAAQRARRRARLQKWK